MFRHYGKVRHGDYAERKQQESVSIFLVTEEGQRLPVRAPGYQRGLWDRFGVTRFAGPR